MNSDRARPGAGTGSLATDIRRICDSATVRYITNVQRGLLVDVALGADPLYWERRAQSLEAARHRPGIDYPGQADVEQLRARWVALTEAAKACRARAQLCPVELLESLVDVLGEVD